MYKVYKIQEYIVQHKKYSQYFIISNGIQSIKNWITMLYTWNQYNTVNQLQENIKITYLLIRLAYIYLYTHEYSIVKDIMERTSYILLVGLQIDAASLEAGASLMDQMVKNLPTMQETWVWSLGHEDPPGEGNDNTLQCSCPEKSMDRGAWQTTVHGVTKSQTQLKWLSMASMEVNMM